MRCFDLQVVSVSMQPDILLPILTCTGSIDSGVIVDIGEHECRAITIAHGRPILQSYITTSVGMSTAFKSFCHILVAACTEIQLETIADNTLARKLFLKAASAVSDPVDLEVNCVCKTLSSSCSSSNSSSSNSSSSDSASSSDASSFILPCHIRRDCFSVLIEGINAAHHLTDENEEIDDEIGGCAGLLLACLKRLNVDQHTL